MTRRNKDSNGKHAFYTDADNIAQGLLDCSFVFDPGGENLDRARKEAAYTLRWWRDDFYIWRDGCWRQVSDVEMKRIITAHIQSVNEKIFDAEQHIPLTVYRVNNVLLSLRGKIGIPEETELLNSWPDGREKLYHTISVKNGLIMVRRNGSEKPGLVEHTPNYFTLSKLPFSYDPDATCPTWLNFLDDVMESRKNYILLLQQWVGYLFRPDLREQKFLLCTGEGANGKGVFFDVVQALIGKENCSEVSLIRFNNPFALYATLGKVVNATNESSHIIEDEAENILKSFVAGDRFTFERKFKEPLTNVVPTAKVMISTNALPRFNDKTQGIWRRILLVPFNKVIPDDAQVKDLSKTIQKELPGILNWALDGLQILNDAGGFTIPESHKELLEEYRRDADPARAFLYENYTFSSNAWGVNCSELYNEYKQYCEENGCRPMSNRLFGRQVRRIFPKVKRTRPGGRGNREWVYQGLVSQVSQEIPI